MLRSASEFQIKGVLQNTPNKKHISWPRKGLADVSFCVRIKLS